MMLFFAGVIVGAAGMFILGFVLMIGRRTNNYHKEWRNE